MFRKRRVLVTGDTGFKGSWLCQWLLRLGADVCGLGLAPATVPSLFDGLKLADQMPHFQVDVRDHVALQRVVAEAEPDIIFHLAAQPLVRMSYLHPKETFDTNVGGVVNCLEAVRQVHSVQACVVVTSDKCYENREWCWGYRETDAVGGRDPYSASKGAAELIVASYRRSFFHAVDSARIATVRAGNVIGGGDWARDRIVPDLVRSIVAGDALVLRNPHAIRPWQHVLDPLSGYLMLAARLCAKDGKDFADAWNLGPGDESNRSVMQLAQALVLKWGQGELRVDADARHPHEAGALKLDCSKAAAQLGWKATWSFDTAVRETVEWYREFYAGNQIVNITDRQIAEFEEASPRTQLRMAA